MSFTKQFIVVFMLIVCSMDVFAYDNYDNWCNLDGQHYYINIDSFTSRDMPSDVLSQLKSTAVFWAEAGADFDFTYSGTTTGCKSHQTICARYETEPGAGVLIGSHAWTNWTFSWYPWCDFFGLNIHTYWILIDAASDWGYNANETRTDFHFAYTAGHEYGHALGGNHTSELLPMCDDVYSTE